MQDNDDAHSLVAIEGNVMRTLATAMIVIASLASGTASAHAHLERSVPAAGATVAAPTAVTLAFTEPVRLTALSLRDAAGRTRTLEPLPKTQGASHSVPVPVPPLAPGAYELTWRAMGRDGHVANGSVSFTVAAAAARP